MGSQPNLASRSEVVSIYKCPEKILGRPFPEIWDTKMIKFGPFCETFTPETAYIRNKTSHQQTKMLVSIYNVSTKTWPTFRDLRPRNGWDPFRHCDPPFGSHYVATIKVATFLVLYVFLLLLGAFCLRRLLIIPPVMTLLPTICLRLFKQSGKMIWV